MLFGYNGLDLTKGELAVEEPEEAFYCNYHGGIAMGMNTILQICQKSLTLNGLKKLDIKKTREYLPAKFLVEDKWNTSC